MGCHECERLRTEFTHVISRNATLLADFEMAIINRENEESERLRLALADVEEERRKSRLRLLAHETVHHQRTLAISA